MDLYPKVFGLRGSIFDDVDVDVEIYVDKEVEFLGARRALKF